MLKHIPKRNEFSLQTFNQKIESVLHHILIFVNVFFIQSL
jgi:hypothetical protein